MKNSAPSSRCRAGFNAALLLGLFALAGCGADDCPAGQHDKDGVCVCDSTGDAPLEGGICPAGAQSDEPGLPLTVGNLVDAGGDVGIGLSMLLGADDRPHLSYYEATNGDLRYATLHPQTGKWIVENVDRTGDAGRFTAVGLVGDAQNAQPVIAYYHGGQRSLKGAFVDAEGKWKTRYLDPIDTQGSVDRGQYVSLVVDNRDVEGEARALVHIAYLDVTSYDLYYLRWDVQNNDVSLPVLVDAGFSEVEGRSYGSGVIFKETSIALLPDGAPVISYRDANSGDLKVAQYLPDSDTWQIVFVDDNPLVELNYKDVGEFSSIAADDLGNLHVSYYNRTEDSLRYGHYDGSSWTLETVDRGKAGTFTSLVLDANRLPYIAYLDASNGAAKIARLRRDGTWQREFAATLDSSGWYVKIALTATTPRPVPAVAYREYWSRRLYFDYVVDPEFP